MHIILVFPATELVGPKFRVVTSATCSSMFAVGQVILGGVAWLVQPWRYMIMTLHIPCFLVVSYYWILPESVRWLLSKEKYAEAKVVLERVARVNRTAISEKSLYALMNPPPPPVIIKKEVSIQTFLCSMLHRLNRPIGYWSYLLKRLYMNFIPNFHNNVAAFVLFH